ncbi:MAG TPA: hypothetical protein VE269_08930 [Gaiellaceae bacterium]|nr:hypothetical protein [Gaiellaceae bacterium]
MRAIDGIRIRIGTRTVRIPGASALCSGAGPLIRQQGVATWSRFSCTFTTFTTAGADRDADFDVLVLDAKRFEVRDARWIGAVR